MKTIEEIMEFAPLPEKTPKPIYQDFHVTVKVTPNDVDPNTIRRLLDEFMGKMEAAVTKNKSGITEIVEIKPI